MRWLLGQLGIPLPSFGVVIRPLTVIVAFLVGTLVTVISAIVPAFLVLALVDEDGVVRLRHDGEKIRVPDPWTHIDVFRRLDDNTRLGCWSTIITVNYDELYKGSGQLPMALAASQASGISGATRSSSSVDALASSAPLKLATKGSARNCSSTALSQPFTETKISP